MAEQPTLTDDSGHLVAAVPQRPGRSVSPMRRSATHTGALSEQNNTEGEVEQEGKESQERMRRKSEQPKSGGTSNLPFPLGDGPATWRPFGAGYAGNNESDSDFSSSSDESDDDGPKHKHKKGKGLPKPGLARQYSRFNYTNEELWTKGRVSKRDGRLKISLNEIANQGYLAKAIGPSIRQRFMPKGSPEDAETKSRASEEERRAQHVPTDIIKEDSMIKRPRMNIVIIVIGSRGDIQPFMKIGKILQDDYGHRVRIATHPAFRDFVSKECGLEFFSVGGNPSELMAFMVKNPGLIPSLETVRAGEIGRRRAQMYEMFEGMWRACINATDEETDKDNLKMSKFSRNHVFHEGYANVFGSEREEPIRCRRNYR